MKNILNPLLHLLVMEEPEKPAQTHPHTTAKHSKGIISFLYTNNLAFGLLIVLVALLAVNGFLIQSMGGSGGSVTLSADLHYDAKTTLKPMPLATGEQPRISGYGSIVKALPTISDLPITASTGDVVKDLVNNALVSAA